MERRHAIIVIKNKNKEYLQYFDKEWNSYLFLNCKVEDENDTKKIEDEIINKLEVTKFDIIYKFDKIHTKYSQRDKIEKEYHHYFYEVVIDELNKEMCNKEFMLNGIKFKWYKYDELLQDKRIQEVNSDIVGYIKSI